MTLDRIAVTGGNGKIGEAILAHLNDRGYGTVNLARGGRREEVSDEYRTTDLLDAGEVYGSLAAGDVDAVIHMGTIPHPRSHPEHVVFQSNVASSYHVLAAGTALGLEAIVLPSSINVVGADFQAAPTEVEYLPVDEAHPLTPRDPYALGKHATEVVGDGFGRRADAPQVASLRYPWVAGGDELRASYVERDRTLDALPDDPKRAGRATMFSYLHLADAASVARRAVEADLEGHETFWTVAADTNVEADSATLAEEFYPGADLRTELGEHEALVSIDKARRLLDWEPEHSWRDLR